MKASLPTTESVGFLDDLFPQFRPRLTKIEYIGTISVFTFYMERADDLHENWKNITNAIAAYYQADFESEETAFERWNIYLFFLVKEPVRARLKVRIENDKFSCRKIVQDETPDDFSAELIHQLIDEHIINADLDFSAGDNRRTTNSPSAFSSDSDIYRLIEGSVLKVVGKSAKVDKDGIETLYQQIINIIR
jgi:hypothetical protein